MNNLQKKLLLLLLVSGVGFSAQAQGFEPGAGFKQVNFGVGASGWGIPVYVGMDFGVSDKITIGPKASYRRYSSSIIVDSFHYTIFNLSFRGDYHFGGHISGLPRELDLYGGMSLGYSIWNNNYKGTNDDDLRTSDLYLSAQAGARWYFNSNWAGHAEVTGGSLSGLSGLQVGLSYSF